MEFLSQSQLDQYKDIIRQINDEFSKSKDLEKAIKEEDNRLIIKHLSKSNLSEKVSHIFVEVFRDYSELLNIHDDIPNNELEELAKAEKCQFYYVEIYIATNLKEKLKFDQNWIVNISVRCTSGCISKSMVMPVSPVPSMSFALSIDENVVESVVEVSLSQRQKNGRWTILRLGKINVDISYQFQKTKPKEKVYSDSKLLQIAQLYNESIDKGQLKTVPTLEYAFPCLITNQTFVKMFIQNCYQKNDVEIFSELGNTKNSIRFFLYTLNGKLSIDFDQQANDLKIKSNVSDLHHLKKYILSCLAGTKIVDENIFLKKMEKLLESTIFEGYDARQSLTLYKDIRKLWFELPL